MHADLRSTAVPGFWSRLVTRLVTSLAVASVAALASGCGDSEPAPDSSQANQTAGGRVGSHAMVITGNAGAAFLSHVPLFDEPHDVQMVAQGTIAGVGAAAVPASFADSLFTFLPDVFSLDALRLGTLKTLQGQLFVGSNEHNGRAVPGKFKFTVSNIVHQHVLDAHQPAPPALTYIVFGSRSATFAVHKIAGAPSFDEVLHVNLVGNDLPTDAELAAGVDAEVPTIPDVMSARLGNSADALNAKGAGHSFTMTRAAALSCLVSPDFFDPCR